MIDFATIGSQIQDRINEHYNDADYLATIAGWSVGGTTLDEKHLPYRDITSLNTLQRLGCRLFHSSILGRSIHENMISYIVGTGHSYTVSAASGANPSDSDIKKAQATIDAMLAWHEWPQMQAETYNRLYRSGDVIDRLIPNGGIVDIVRIEPHTLRGDTDAPFGIRYAKGDVRSPETYLIHDATTTKPNKAWDRNAVICHGKRGVDSNDPRGVPLLGAPYCEVRAIDELYHGLTKVMAALFDHVIVYNYGEADKVKRAMAVAAGQTAAREELQRNGKFNNAGGTHHAAGHTVEIHGDAFNAQQIVFAMSALTRRIGVLCGLPEFIITGDADTGSRNSLLSAEGPATRRFAREAGSGATYEKQILYHAIAASRGTFGDPKAYRELRANFQIQAKPPLAETQDKPAETNRVLSAMREKVYSPQHACQLLGVDPEQMLAQWEQWDERLAKGREALGRIVGVKPEDVEKMVNAAATLINAGLDPTEALTKVGLDPVEHVELVRQQTQQQNTQQDQTAMA